MPANHSITKVISPNFNMFFIVMVHISSDRSMLYTIAKKIFPCRRTVSRTFRSFPLIGVTTWM